MVAVAAVSLTVVSVSEAAAAAFALGGMASAEVASAKRQHSRHRPPQLAWQAPRLLAVLDLANGGHPMTGCRSSNRNLAGSYIG
jgi:hypothetical protein